MAKRVRLTESALRNIINQCIYEAVQSGELDEGWLGKIKGGIQGAAQNIGNSFKNGWNNGNGIKGGLQNIGQGLKGMRNDIRQGAYQGDVKQEEGKIDKLFDQLSDYIQNYNDEVGQYVRDKAAELSKRQFVKGGIRSSAAKQAIQNRPQGMYGQTTPGVA